jgi:hypothetical protein
VVVISTTEGRVLATVVVNAAWSTCAGEAVVATAEEPAAEGRVLPLVQALKAVVVSAAAMARK